MHTEFSSFHCFLKDRYSCSKQVLSVKGFTGNLVIIDICFQGFQLLSDIHDGMGGVSCGILQHLADEYGSKDFITFITSPPHLAPSTDPARILMQASIIQVVQISLILFPLIFTPTFNWMMLTGEQSPC